MRDTIRVLRWCASLGRKFTIVVPWATSAVVLSTLVSQFAIMLATFLPLKIVILLGSDGIPRYFPASFADVDRDLLVGLLSGGAAVAFVIHLMIERVIKASSELGARRLLEQSQKLVLFENQDQIAAKAYQRYARALAGGVFVALVFLILVLVYPEMALVLSGYTLMLVVAYHVAASLSESIRAVVSNKLQMFTSVTGKIGFLVGFLWLVIDFLFREPPGLLPAVIALLLSRLAFTRLSGMVVDIVALSKQQAKLDALFFHGKILMPGPSVDRLSIWSLLDPGVRRDWVAVVIEEFDPSFNAPFHSADVGWLQLRVPSVAGLLVSSASLSHRVLLKLYDRPRQGMAGHEADLLTSGVAGLPAPEWLGTTIIEERRCHLMKVDAEASSPDVGSFKEYKLEVLRALFAVTPPAGLVQRYRRSRPQLYQRVDAAWFDRIAVAAGEDEMNQVRRVQGMTVTIKQQLRELPPCIVNPELTAEHVLIVNGSTLLIHWGEWAIEPLGSGWPVGASALEQIDDALVDASKLRGFVGEISPHAVRLAALVYALESKVRLQSLKDALDLVPELERSLNALQGPEAASVGEP